MSGRSGLTNIRHPHSIARPIARLVIAVLLGGFWTSALAGSPPAPGLAQFAFVTNQLGDSLSAVDLTAGKQTAEIKIGGKPAGIALSPDGRIAYLAAPESREVISVDTASTSILKRAAVGQGPLGIAVNPVSGEVYVADWYEHRLYAIDPTSLEITGSVAVGQSPSGIAVSPDGKMILTADRDSNQVSIIDAASRTVVATMPTGDRPFGVTIDKSGGRAYTANVASNSITVLDLQSRTRVQDVAVGMRPYAVALAQGKIFVTNQHGQSVSVLDAATLKTLATLPVGSFPEGIEADPTERFVYVACWDSNTLERIDVATLTVNSRIEVGAGPRAFGRFLK